MSSWSHSHMVTTPASTMASTVPSLLTLPACDGSTMAELQHRYHLKSLCLVGSFVKDLCCFVYPCGGQPTVTCDLLPINVFVAMVVALAQGKQQKKKGAGH